MKNQLVSKIQLCSIVATIQFVLCFSGVVDATPIQEGVFKRATDEQPEKATSDADPVESETSKKPVGSTVIKESTAEITKQSDGWVTIDDDASSSEWRFPGSPTYKEFKFSPIAGREPVVNHFYKILVDGRTEVAFSWMDLHDSIPGGTKLKNALDGAVRGAVGNVIGQLSKMENIKLDKVQGREYEYTYSLRAPQGKKDIMIAGKARVFIKGKRQYQMHVLTPLGKEEPELTQKYFDSLIIKEEETPEQ